jgi:hypothetical protein
MYVNSNVSGIHLTDQINQILSLNGWKNFNKVDLFVKFNICLKEVYYFIINYQTANSYVISTISKINK